MRIFFIVKNCNGKMIQIYLSETNFHSTVLQKEKKTKLERKIKENTANGKLLYFHNFFIIGFIVN